MKQIFHFRPDHVKIIDAEKVDGIRYLDVKSSLYMCTCIKGLHQLVDIEIYISYKY